MISEYGEKPVVVNDLLHWFAFDSMGDYGFGQDFGLMRERKWSRAATNLHSSLSVLGYLSPAIWVCILAFFFMPGLWKVKHWFQMIEFGDNCIEKRKNVRSDPCLSPVFRGSLALLTNCSNLLDTWI